MSRSRLRLVVVQVMVASLFLTLGARLFYLQVMSGKTYNAAAVAQAVRDTIIPAPRGLIVDDQGRPLVANRGIWVVSVDRHILGGMSPEDQKALLSRVAGAVGQNYDDIHARTLLCSEPGAIAGVCWNGQPVQPIPVAKDVPQAVAVQFLERSEEFPGILAQTETARAYPAPFGVNGAHVLGYLSQVTSDELKHAKATNDATLTAASEVGRAGLEQQYDKFLRGVAGYTQVAVNSQGRVIGDTSQVDPSPGDTLVTSIDARVQSVVEQQLAQAIATARQSYDKVSGRNFVADSGAAVVMDAHTGRIVALASEPTYDPNQWVGGISAANLQALTDPGANFPLLSRATQGQFAPGSTWKPEMTVAALNNGFTPQTKLACPSSLQIGNRAFGNFESEHFGPIDFAKAIAVSCDTFFYQVALSYWNQFGKNVNNVDAKDPLVDIAKSFGFGQASGVDLPGEATGRIADRKWKTAYWKQNKDKYCALDQAGTATGFDRLYAHEFCVGGNQWGPGDSANFAIGQGDTLVTPLQLARAYAAISNGGTLFEPRVARAIVAPDGHVVQDLAPVVQGHIPDGTNALAYVDDALTGTLRPGGTAAWKFVGFPLDQVQLHAKTGTAEVQGKQSTSWLATYTKDYVVVMMVSQGGTGSGTSGDAVRKIWESLYGVTGTNVDPASAAVPGVTLPDALPSFAKDGSIAAPARKAGQ